MRVEAVGPFGGRWYLERVSSHENDTGEKNYDRLIEQISATYTAGRGRALQAVSTQLLDTYWKVGEHIVEFEQGGRVKAEYGKDLVTRLAKDLSRLHGKGFSRSNVFFMRKFYIQFQIVQTLSGLLSWSHAVELLKIDDPLERGFYVKQMALEKWSVRELQRQKTRRGWSRIILVTSASR